MTTGTAAKNADPAVRPFHVNMTAALKEAR
jgi:hypothetical protein